MNALPEHEASDARGVDEALFETVGKAWSETAGVAFDPQQSWQDAGADSMTSLHLLLALEQALQRRLSFDLIDPEMTGYGLARSLQRLEEAARLERVAHRAQDPSTGGQAAAAACTAEAAPQPPPVFLLPGIHGDEPRLAEFRRAFGGRLRFELVELPPLDDPAVLLADIAASGRHAAREIERRRPNGPLLLAGYSFGGAVAFEAARHLHGAGREIAWLAILDTRFVGAPWRRAWWRFDLQLIRSAAGIDPARQALLAAVRRLSPARSIRVRQLLLDELRLKAMRRWQPAALDVPALIAASTQADAATVERWQRLCPDGTLLRLPTGHLELFRPPSLERLIAVFETAVREATAQTPATQATPAMPGASGGRHRHRVATA